MNMGKIPMGSFHWQSQASIDLIFSFSLDFIWETGCDHFHSPNLNSGDPATPPLIPVILVNQIDDLL